MNRREYKFNGGQGAVLCAQCSTIVCSGLRADQPITEAAQCTEGAIELPDGRVFCSVACQQLSTGNTNDPTASVMVLEELLAECEAKANEAKAIAEKATKGPWVAHHYGPSDCRVRLDIVGANDPVIFLDNRTYDSQTIGGCGANVNNADDDARFIAHARTSNPDLADRVLLLVKMVRGRDERCALLEQQLALRTDPDVT